MSDGVSIETYRKADEIMRVCRDAVRKAQEESRRLGVPNAYCINGVRYWELPNGDYTRVPPDDVAANGPEDGGSNG